jgi:ribosomal protein S18 acetylase RimI-like enzyme
MPSTPFQMEPLGSAHDRSAFRCGEEVLDRYLQTQAAQDIRRRVANCFFAVETAAGRIAAYYTLSSASIPMIDLPHEETRRLPRYPTLPAVRIGRLAVDRAFQGRGLGAALLADAAHRARHADIAAFTLLVDAKNDEAVAFYRHHGFRTLASQPRMLFLPLSTAQKSFG